jgi:hypothetical protein
VGRRVRAARAELAAAELNDDGGIDGPPVVSRCSTTPAHRSAPPDNARTAVERGAVALITDGVGAVAVSEVTDPVPLPVFVVFEGGESIVDPEQRPTLFRLAPANRPMSQRLADYVSERAGSVALIGDGSSYGREGVEATRANLARNEVVVSSETSIARGGRRRARRRCWQARSSGAEALIVWARASGVAAVVRAARSAGWDVPIFTGPTGEDPLVRQRWPTGRVARRADVRVVPHHQRGRPGAVRGLPRGVRGAVRRRRGRRRGGRPAGADAARLVDLLLRRGEAHGGRPGRLRRAAGTPLMEALDSTVITGANGDERGFGPTDREGVSPDDMYFGRFSDLRFSPRRRRRLSTNLPPVPQ